MSNAFHWGDLVYRVQAWYDGAIVDGLTIAALMKSTITHGYLRFNIEDLSG